PTPPPDRGGRAAARPGLPRPGDRPGRAPVLATPSTSVGASETPAGGRPYPHPSALHVAHGHRGAVGLARPLAVPGCPGAPIGPRPRARRLPGHGHVVLVDRAATERPAAAPPRRRRHVRLHRGPAERGAGSPPG